jgi:hypothetical protein
MQFEEISASGTKLKSNGQFVILKDGRFEHQQTEDNKALMVDTHEIASGQYMLQQTMWSTWGYTSVNILCFAILSMAIYMWISSDVVGMRAKCAEFYAVFEGHPGVIPPVQLTRWT